MRRTEEQIQALERFEVEYREQPIKVGDAGELVAVDTFYAGTLRGVGKVYIQTVLDGLRPLRLGCGSTRRRCRPRRSRS